MTAHSLQPEPVAQLARQALDFVAYGIVIMTEEMKVILHNETATEMIAAADGISLACGYFTLGQAQTEELKDRIQVSHGRIADPDSPRTIVLRVDRPSGKQPYQLTACPLCQDSEEQMSEHHGVWIVAIHDAERPRELPRSLLSDYFGMTDAELDVCQRLFISGTVANVADELGISKNTVKTHLKRIFAKCGVNSQSLLLMRLALCLK